MKIHFTTIILLGLLYCTAARSNGLSLNAVPANAALMIADTSAPKKSSGTNKDGSPDMRLKKNKDAAKAAANATQTPVTPAPAPKIIPAAPVKPASPVVNNPTPQKITPVVTPQPAVKTADKVVGTDSKGRTIYEGSKGGRYYINKNGNKEYIKKT